MDIPKLRIYRYKDEEFQVKPGMSKNGGVRLVGEHVDDPKDADVFVVPQAIWGLLGGTHKTLPYIKGNESRHLFFDMIEKWPSLGVGRCIYIRAATRQSYLQKEPSAVSWSWPVEDYKDRMELPEGGFKYDISFVGWRTPREDTEKACHSVKRLSSCSSFIRVHRDFYGYRDPKTDPEAVRRRIEFLDVQQVSRLLLCPQSVYGVFRYRFFEALSAGRIPVHIGYDYVLPFADRIPWNDIAFFIHTKDASRAGELCMEWLKGKSDDDLIEMGKLGREMYDKWLHRDRWPEHMTIVVGEKLKQWGLIQQ